MEALQEVRSRVVTYNVLSSHLSDPSYYTSCKSEFLRQSYRLELLKQKLESEIVRQATFCLQEVSRDWADALKPFFLKAGYSFHTSLYGQQFTGNMGVAIAFPMSIFDLTDLHTVCVADTAPQSSSKAYAYNSPPRSQPYHPSSFSPMSMITHAFLSPPRIHQPQHTHPPPFGLFPRQANSKLWFNALNRPNKLLCAKLMHKSSGRSLAIATYHMPCAPDTPALMTIHAALAAQYLLRYADAMPLVFAGDFNSKPHSAAYDILTQGHASNMDEGYPPECPNSGAEWSPDIDARFQSCYVAATGQEPEFTNYAKVREDPVFIDTLDYVFCSADWHVDSVLPLPAKRDAGDMIPNALEPSDHLMIAADLSLPPSIAQSSA